MPLDAFLQFSSPGAAGAEIEGETQDREMKQLKPPPFDLQDWRFGISQEVNVGSSAGGIGAGKVTFEQFTVSKQIDHASPDFFATCCTGGHYKDVMLLIRKAGTDRSKSGGVYLRFDFKMVFVAKIDWSGDDSPSPKEEITFDYGALRLNYKPQTATGGLDATQSTAWSRVLNQAVLQVDSDPEPEALK
jgi:type VI secretion system secreted protein Hcp